MTGEMKTRRRGRRIVALGLTMSALVVGTSACVLSPRYKSYQGGVYECELQLGPEWTPVEGHVPPTLIRPVVGDLIFEACWTLD